MYSWICVKNDLKHAYVFMPASLSCPTTSFIEIDDINFFLKEFVLPLLKVWQSLNLMDDCLGGVVPHYICIYQSDITSYMSFSSERELTLTRSTSRFMCCWDALNCHRLFMSDCAIRWHFYNNSKFIVDIWITCILWITPLVKLLSCFWLLFYLYIQSWTVKFFWEIHMVSSNVLSWLTVRSKSRLLLDI